MSWACSSLRKEHGELPDEFPSELGVETAVAAVREFGNAGWQKCQSLNALLWPSGRRF